MRALSTIISASVFLMITAAVPANAAKEEAVAAPEASAAASEPAAKAAAVKGISERFEASLAATHDAAVAALKMNGFDIKSDEPALITGSRPHKIGLIVGSGGEKIKVTLTADGDVATVANVKTQKTFVGMAGQKNWDASVIEAIKTSLAETTIAAAAPAVDAAAATAAVTETAPASTAPAAQEGAALAPTTVAPSTTAETVADPAAPQ